MKVKNLYIGDIYAVVEKEENSRFVVKLDKVRRTILEKIDNQRVYDIINDSTCCLYEPITYNKDEEFALNLEQEELMCALSSYHRKNISKKKLLKMVKGIINK